MAAPCQTMVLDALRLGVEAIETVAASISDDGWHRTVAPDWSAAEMARHVLAVSRWYHAWLDTSLAGDPEPPFGVEELVDRNELEIYELRHMTGPDAISAFCESAAAYTDRLAADPALWTHPYGYPAGVSTVGLHAGLAVGEWHLHAWDLSLGTYRPVDPASVLRVVSHSVLARESALSGLVGRGLLPVLARRDPWALLLKRSGR